MYCFPLTPRSYCNTFDALVLCTWFSSYFWLWMCVCIYIYVLDFADIFVLSECSLCVYCWYTCLYFCLCKAYWAYYTGIQKATIISSNNSRHNKSHCTIKYTKWEIFLKGHPNEKNKNPQDFAHKNLAFCYFSQLSSLFKTYRRYPEYTHYEQSICGKK